MCFRFTVSRIHASCLVRKRYFFYNLFFSFICARVLPLSVAGSCLYALYGNFVDRMSFGCSVVKREICDVFLPGNIFSGVEKRIRAKYASTLHATGLVTRPISA